MIPISGSAYTYAYATLGELAAWIIGCLLTLEYAVGPSAVAVGWSGYVSSLLRDVGVVVPPAFTAPPGTVLVETAPRHWEVLANVAAAPGRAGHRPGDAGARNRPLQRARRGDRAGDDGRAGRRHPGIGQPQRRHRRRQGGGDRWCSSAPAPPSCGPNTGRRSFRPTPASSAATATPASCAARPWCSSLTWASTR